MTNWNFAHLTRTGRNNTYSFNTFSSEEYTEIDHPTAQSRNFSDIFSLSQSTLAMTNLKSYYLVPFSLILCCCIVSGLLWMRTRSYENVLDTDYTPEKENNSRSRKQCILRTLVITIEFFRSCLYHGIGSLVVTYVIKYLEFGKSTASDISLTFFLASSLVPIPVVFLSRYFPSKTLVGVSLVIATITMIITWLIIDQHTFVIWIWAAFCGLCLPGGEVPCLSWYKEMNKASATTISFFVTAFALGAMIGPGLTGLLMSWQKPAWFMHSLLAMLVVLDVMYTATFIVDRWRRSSAKTQHDDTMICGRCANSNTITQIMISRYSLCCPLAS